MTVDTRLAASVDLAALAESWGIALDAQRKSKATIKAYRAGSDGFLRWHADAYPGTTPVLDRASVNLYLADLRNSGQSAGTARLRFNALKLFSAWLTAEGEFDRDPLYGMKPPKMGKPAVPSVADSDIELLLKACRGGRFADRRDYAIVQLLASTGIRAGECVALTVADIDLKARAATVQHGKGDKARLVPLLPDTAQALDRYLRVRKAHRFAHTAPLWLGAGGRREFGYQGMAAALRIRAQSVGIEGFHPHRLRHSFASRWLAAGGSEDGLMAAAGWADRNMISRYTEDTRQRRAAVEAERLQLDKFTV